MSTDQKQEKAAVKESLMDFVGHFSTASAILTGFFITTCVFIIGVKASITDPKTFAFLDEPLLENNIIGVNGRNLLQTFNLVDYWPSNFQYMVGIFVILFILGLFSYATFIWVGILQMSNYRKYSEETEKKVLNWLQRGMNTLFLTLILSFISLPWVLFRFIVDNAASVSLLLITLLLAGLASVLGLLNVFRKN
ncbi:MAG: hypothetical protein ACW99A_20025 [Candidatus Kariarchaeaceae archaeon]|jgi:hypothetical protein